jgi:hypothetical protein
MESNWYAMVGKEKHCSGLCKMILRNLLNVTGMLNHRYRGEMLA